MLTLMVSIPQGTIKSLLRLLLPFNQQVSIPHGTIKSLHQTFLRLISLLFQFHMVRLKVTRTGRARRPIRVSIPHGTIKRCGWTCTVRGRCMFQFHMVRLKVGCMGVMPDELHAFQFHMVRLKDIAGGG